MPPYALGRANSVAELLTHDSLYPPAASCLHPVCAELCTYPMNTQGRRQLFCSKQCATDYSQTRQALVGEISSIDSALVELPKWGKVAVQLRQQRSRVVWHLARYGGEPTELP